MDNKTTVMEVSEVQQLHNAALESMPSHSHIQFPQFSKLPGELRQTIWKFACLVPRIHIIKAPADGHRIALQPYNRSRSNPILNTCSEARNVVLSLQLNYFCPYEYFNEDKQAALTTSRRNRFIDALDTFWFEHEPNDDEYERVPQSIYDLASWHCGHCHRTQTWPQGCRSGCFASKRDIPLRSIAINLADWLLTDEGDEFWDSWGSLGHAYLHNVQEILIVVEKFGAFDHERDPIFLSPPEKDRRIILETRRHNGVDEDMFFHAAKEASWADSARFIEQQLGGFRQECIWTRQGFMNDGTYTESEESIYPDLSEWKIPKIRFVEARKGSDRRLLLS